MVLSIPRFIALVVAMSAVSACQPTRPLLIKGQAVLQGGQPVSNVTVVIAELHGYPFMMPGTTQRVKLKTNEKGVFLATMEYKGGFLSIFVPVKPCKFTSPGVIITQAELEDVNTVTTKLTIDPPAPSCAHQRPPVKQPGAKRAQRVRRKGSGLVS